MSFRQQPQTDPQRRREEIAEQVSAGTLTIRQATPEERERYGIRPADPPPASRRAAEQADPERARLDDLIRHLLKRKLMSQADIARVLSLSARTVATRAATPEQRAAANQRRTERRRVRHGEEGSR